MEEIAHSTVQDRYKLFQTKGANGKVSERGFMITVNPCSDKTAVYVCDAVVEYARGMKCNTLLAIETIQFRGEKRKKKRTRICRPHAHLVVDVPLEEAAAIAAFFSTGGSNVEIDPVCGAEGLCEYLSKDPKGYFYAREVFHAASVVKADRPISETDPARTRTVLCDRNTEASPSAPWKAGRARRYEAIQIPLLTFHAARWACIVAVVRGWSMTRAP